MSVILGSLDLCPRKVETAAMLSILWHILAGVYRVSNVNISTCRFTTTVHASVTCTGRNLISSADNSLYHTITNR